MPQLIAYILKQLKMYVDEIFIFSQHTKEKISNRYMTLFIKSFFQPLIGFLLQSMMEIFLIMYMLSQCKAGYI